MAKKIPRYIQDGDNFTTETFSAFYAVSDDSINSMRQTYHEAIDAITECLTHGFNRNLFLW